MLVAAISGEKTSKGLSVDTYRRLLRDPLTTVGIDFWAGPAGSTVQPSARVCIGDLTGTKPGLLPLQGTCIAADGTPQPWMTSPISGELIKIGGRVSAVAESDLRVTFDAGRYADQGIEFRLFITESFSALPSGSSFPGYDLVLFGPDDTNVRARVGDAFASGQVGPVEITRKKSKFTLDFVEHLRGPYLSAQVVVPGEEHDVLLATGFRLKF